jgi:hypothetical protein
MWHEVALTGMVAICLRSKVDTPESLRRSAPAYVWTGPTRHHLAARGSGRSSAELGLRRTSGRARTGSRNAGRARVPATVRIQAVILGPSSGDQGPNNAAELVSDATARDARDSDAIESIPYDVEKSLRTAGIKPTRGRSDWMMISRRQRTLGDRIGAYSTLSSSF